MIPPLSPEAELRISVRHLEAFQILRDHLVHHWSSESADPFNLELADSCPMALLPSFEEYSQVLLFARVRELALAIADERQFIEELTECGIPSVVSELIPADAQCWMKAAGENHYIMTLDFPFGVEQFDEAALDSGLLTNLRQAAASCSCCTWERAIEESFFFACPEYLSEARDSWRSLYNQYRLALRRYDNRERFRTTMERSLASRLPTCERIRLEAMLAQTKKLECAPDARPSPGAECPTGFPGEVVRELRRQRAWTTAKLATKAGVSDTTIRNFEAKSKGHASTIQSIAGALGAPVEWLTRDPQSSKRR
jgi:DNA-binding XRE family transcriptional regulator